MVGTKGTVGAILKRGGSPLGEVTDLKSAYRKLQIVVGVIAVTLCPIVVGAEHLFGDATELKGSVSAYYYGRGGNWFVGGLVAMAVFFLTYQYKPRQDDFQVDNLQSTFASICAAAVALAPTSNSKDPQGSELIVDYVHGIGAGLLFISLAVFSLYHFTKTRHDAKACSLRDHVMRFVRTDWVVIEAAARAKGVRVSPQKKIRNRIYRVCGWLIVVALLLAVLTFFVELGRVFFWAEVLAVTAFGLSWLVKGRAFPWLNDKLNDIHEVEPSWDEAFPIDINNVDAEVEDEANPAWADPFTIDTEADKRAATSR